ncbi:hypothetical protein [uncultured Rubinisphaera sp.]|uniref:hypothetical protein n=1 Tax=uncultured Rubinisphaera sp. TaxID=1678686 RepID=UPI0030DD3F2E
MTRLSIATIFMMSLALLAGCSEEEIVFNEVKHPHEMLKASEVSQFLKIVHGLPDHKLPPLPPLFTQAPEWEFDRELTVAGLVREVQKTNGRHWLSASVVSKLENHQPLQKLLEEYQLSTPQFLGLAESVCMAAARTFYPEEDQLKQIIRDGRVKLDYLENQQDIFAALSEEDKYEIIHLATWIARVDRAERLAEVPIENIELIQRHWEVISPFLPQECQQDPMSDIVDTLQVYGMPFEELPGSGLDSELTWNPSDHRVRIEHATEQQISQYDLEKSHRNTRNLADRDESIEK